MAITPTITPRDVACLGHNFRYGRMERRDYTAALFRGDATFWRNLLSPVPPPRFQNLYAGVRAETCQVSGNAELYWACFAALTRLFDVMRDVENK